MLFDFDEYTLKEETRENLANLSNTLAKYPDTDVHILGHTDNIGSESYNLELSKKRASSVTSYLVQESIDRNRLEIMGMGETDPVNTNETEEGREDNRRVEITIVANDKLIKDAKKGDIPGV